MSWLAVGLGAALGAWLASAGGGSDPSTLVTATFGVMAVPVLLLIMHGPVATNILNLYSCSLAALTVGIRAARWKVTLVAGAVAATVLAVFVQADDFARFDCKTHIGQRPDCSEIFRNAADVEQSHPAFLPQMRLKSRPCVRSFRHPRSL